MYKQNKYEKTTISRNTGYKGESIETKVERIINNKEPISDGAPLIYTDRSDGVLPEYDVRTDRFEIAIDAMDKVSKTHQAKREERLKAAQLAKETATNKPNIGGPEPIPTTGTTD